MSIEAIVDGSEEDYTINEEKVEITSLITDPEIQIQVPSISEIEHLFKFRVKAMAKGGYISFTDDIEILMVMCGH